MSRNINDEDDVDDGLILFLLDLCSNIKACLLKVAADILLCRLCCDNCDESWYIFYFYLFKSVVDLWSV